MFTAAFHTDKTFRVLRDNVCVHSFPLPFFFFVADALTAVLTKINRLDIVTLLEGPIFDYGNISGTRCFADDNAVFLDQADGKV